MPRKQSAVNPQHVTAEQLAAGIAELCDSPREQGRVDLVVVRPMQGKRQCLERVLISLEAGVVGDRWLTTSWKKLANGSAHPAVQVTLMNARCIRLIAGEPTNWAIAGDNLFVDLDLSRENLPTGARLKIGECILQITSVAHNGCWKFKDRFGEAAVKFVNSPEGKKLRLRGVHARVVQGGEVAVGDCIERLPPGA